MKLLFKILTFFGALALTNCISSPKSHRTPAATSAEESHQLDRKIETMFERSLPRMACNLSVGSPGSIIASPEAEDPNYYYHWIRDSAIIVKSMSRLLPKVRGSSSEDAIHKFILDFARFSKQLQASPTSQGAGETRFHVDGSVDNSIWPRPQYDGPPLRALALLEFLKQDDAKLSRTERQLVRSVLRADLDSTARHFGDRGFDLWEYANGYHFFTRLVQISALEKGVEYFHSRAPAAWNQAAAKLKIQIQKHWHPEFGVITWEGPVTNSDGNSIPIHFYNYDTSVSLAVIHATPKIDFGDLDERVWSTLWKQEEYFLKKFPVNAGKVYGPTIGRNPGDNYYGGNAFFFLTSAFAEHSFRAASQLIDAKTDMPVTAFRAPTLSHLLQRPVREGEIFKAPQTEVARAFAAEGDAFLKTMLDVIPADGMMAEQMSKKDGSPVSARDLTWSYASLLTAVLEREEWRPSTVDFSKINFVCPDPSIGRPRKKAQP